MATPEQREAFTDGLKLALVVVPDPTGPGLPAIDYAANDAKLLADQLQLQGYKVSLITAAEAAPPAIRDELAGMKARLEGSSQSMFLLVLVTNGLRGKDLKPQVMASGGLMPVAEIRDLAKAVRATRTLIIMDIFHPVEPPNKNVSLNDFPSGDGIAMLLSARAGGLSRSDSSTGKGLFLHYAAEGLAGKAAGKDGLVTFFDLKKYVDDQVVDHTMKLPKKPIQKPFALGEGGGDFLVSTAVQPKVEAPKPLPPDPPKQSEPETKATRVAPVPVRLTRDGKVRADYLVKLQGQTLTIQKEDDAHTLVVSALLEERVPDVPAPGFQFFSGLGQGNDRYDFAAKVNGTTVELIKGRLGVPCKDDRPCSKPTEVPILPGEREKKVERGLDAVGKVAGPLKKLKERVSGKPSGSAEKVEAGAAAGKEGVKHADPFLRYTWTSFNLSHGIPAAN